MLTIAACRESIEVLRELYIEITYHSFGASQAANFCVLLQLLSI